MPKKPPEETPLYVKIPTSSVDKIGRTAEALGVSKKELIATLVAKYVDPDTRQGLDLLRAMAQPKRVTVDMEPAGPTMGTYSFQAYDPPEIMSVEQTALFLQVEEAVVLELAEAGELPGRKLGKAWRFSRAALVQWLAQPGGKR